MCLDLTVLLTTTTAVYPVFKSLNVPTFAGNGPTCCGAERNLNRAVHTVTQKMNVVLQLVWLQLVDPDIYQKY